jgi:spore maturation protein SpmA
MPFVYLLHIILYFAFGQYQEKNVGKAIIYNLVSIVCMALAVIKIMQYVRVIDNFGFLVQMITQVFSDLGPFFVVFGMFVLFFSLVI